MLGHRCASEAAGAAQLGRPEIDHLYEMSIPVNHVFFKNRPKARIFSRFCIKIVNEPRDFFFSVEVRIGCRYGMCCHSDIYFIFIVDRTLLCNSMRTIFSISTYAAIHVMINRAFCFFYNAIITKSCKVISRAFTYLIPMRRQSR